MNKLRCRQTVSFKGYVNYLTYNGDAPAIFGKGNTPKASYLSYNARVRRAILDVVELNK